MSEDYKPQSYDAMFSRIMARLDQQSRDSADHRAELMGVLTEVRAEVRMTNGRVKGLERWRDVINARVGVIAAGISGVVTFAAWVIQRFT